MPELKKKKAAASFIPRCVRACVRVCVFVSVCVSVCVCVCVCVCLWLWLWLWLCVCALFPFDPKLGPNTFAEFIDSHPPPTTTITSSSSSPSSSSSSSLATSDVDTSAIAFKDANREKQRQANLKRRQDEVQ